ncbi:APSES transcription factor Xbp1 protein [Rutstroemia sp. NJR-2017a WRK4]|nr:APSES transcription factor Xbp1 protein [Rutstroemia sp. NJR-2017a WRK4]
MASIASLLNPVNSVRRVRLPSSSTPSPSLCTRPSSYGNISPQFPPSTKKLKMTKNGVVSAKGKIQGDITYPPFDHLDERTKREVETFGVDLMSGIQTKNIPYANKTNDPRKDFFSKTGRESFEVFTYEFKVPDHNDNKSWTVMWDYEIGLVRITPFFKCFKYAKTMPGRMLDLNPGLKDISHSITGGALTAQGYWMPFECARALCATFCHKIAYALVPMFGPDFPSQCSSPGAPEHCVMKIDPSITITATVQAEKYRLKYMRRALTSSTSSLPSAAASLPTSAPTPTLASSSASAFASTPTSAASSPQNRRINLKRHVSESSFADDVEVWDRAATADAGSDVDGGYASWNRRAQNESQSPSSPSSLYDYQQQYSLGRDRSQSHWRSASLAYRDHYDDYEPQAEYQEGYPLSNVRNTVVEAQRLGYPGSKESLGGLGITVANPVLSSIPRSVPHFSTPEEWIGMVKRSVEVMDEKFSLEESLGFTTDEKIPGEDVALWKSMHALASRQKDMIQAVSPPQEEHEVVLHEPEVDDLPSTSGALPETAPIQHTVAPMSPTEADREGASILLRMSSQRPESASFSRDASLDTSAPVTRATRSNRESLDLRLEMLDLDLEAPRVKRRRCRSF